MTLGPFTAAPPFLLQHLVLSDAATPALAANRGWLDIVGGLLERSVASPLTTVIWAAIIVSASLFFAPMRNRRVWQAYDSSNDALRARYVPEMRALSIIAGALLLLVLLERLFVGHIWGGETVFTPMWSEYATPLIATTVAFVIMSIIFRAHMKTPSMKTGAFAERRTWRSFVSGTSLLTFAAPSFVLLLTIILCGMSASADSAGRSTMIYIDVANTDIEPLGFRFFGWYFSIPVLIALVLILVFGWIALHLSSVRTYASAISRTTERGLRRESNNAIVTIASAGVALTLGAIFRTIAGANIHGLTVQGEGTEEMYTVGKNFAVVLSAAGWVAPMLEILAFAALLWILIKQVPASPTSDQDANSVEKAEVL